MNIVKYFFSLNMICIIFFTVFFYYIHSKDNILSNILYTLEIVETNKFTSNKFPCSIDKFDNFFTWEMYTENYVNWSKNFLFTYFFICCL